MSEIVERKKSAITLGHLTNRNIKQLKVLNSTVLPVQYYDKFYDQLLTNPDLTRWAYYNDIFVGAVSTRLEDGGKQLYIMTLGVLEPYRRLGIATHLLDYVMEYVSKNPKITQIYLHVQTVNTVALKFYEKHGFTVTETVPNYYHKVDEKDAYIITKKIQAPVKEK